MNGKRTKRDNAHTNRAVQVVSLVLAIGIIVAASNRSPHAVPTAVAQSPPAPAPYSANSPHWPHINVLDFGRAARAIPNAATRNQAYEWLARHVDVIETSMDNYTYQLSDTLSTYLHSLNPTMKTFGYDYDLTMCQKANCNESLGPNPYFSNLPEEQYLHFSEDTQLQLKDLDGNVTGTVNVTGCPEPQPIAAGCRVQIFKWTQSRWLPNLKDATWRQSFADHLVQITQVNSAGQPNVVDGLFLDEHGPGFSVAMGIGGQTKILSGGGIREYGGAVPRDAAVIANPNVLDSEYTADVNTWLSYLRTRLASAGKFMHINVAEYFLDASAFSNAVAAQGAMTEHLNRHDSNGLHSHVQYQTLLDDIRQLTQAGGTVDLSGSWCNDGPVGYVAGNYPTPKGRYRMWSLASYYLAKESVGYPGKVYFDPNLCIEQSSQTPMDFVNEWLPAYEINVGQPVDLASVYQQGPIPCSGAGYAVFRRQYENAMVLLRPRDAWGCSTFGDSTAVNVPLPETMVMLQPNGTYSQNLTSLSLRNGEAVILFPAQDVTAPSAVTDLNAI